MGRFPGKPGSLDDPGPGYTQARVYPDPGQLKRVVGVPVPGYTVGREDDVAKMKQHGSDALKSCGAAAEEEDVAASAR